MLDLTNLTPAPWDYKRILLGHPDNPKNPIVNGTTNRGDHCYVARISSQTSTIPGMTSRAPSAESAEANANFIALARNAFDVMMRRKWWAQEESCGLWLVYGWGDDKTYKGPRQGKAGCLFYASDPFTALVEADKWMKENLENKNKGK